MRARVHGVGRGCQQETREEGEETRGGDKQVAPLAASRMLQPCMRVRVRGHTHTNSSHLTHTHTHTHTHTGFKVNLVFKVGGSVRS